LVGPLSFIGWLSDLARRGAKGGGVACGKFLILLSNVKQMYMNTRQNMKGGTLSNDTTTPAISATERS